ncbi:MAG: uroporphyrinogen decarboxylase family protein, partial [Bryobacteraceae bacterium]
MWVCSDPPLVKARSWISAINRRHGWPVAFWRHHPVADQNAAGLADATIAFQGQFQFDIVKVTPAGTYQAVDYGLIDAWLGDPLGRRDIVERPVKNVVDWKTVLRRPSPGPRVEAALDAAGRIAGVLGDSAIVLLTVFNPLTQLVQLCGAPLLNNQIDTNPAAIESAIERVTADTCRLIREAAGRGADGIYLATQSMNHHMFTPAQYARWGRPYDFQCIRAAREMSCNVLHVHGEQIYFALPDLTDAWALH